MDVSCGIGLVCEPWHSVWVGGLMKKYFFRGFLTVGIVLVLWLTSCIIASAEAVLTENNTSVIQKRKIREYDEKTNFDAVIKAANEYLRFDPQNKEVLIRLARNYKAKKEYLLAKKTLARALGIDPRDAWALRELARVYLEEYKVEKQGGLKKKYLDLAQASIESSLTYAPQNQWSNEVLALIYFYKKDKVRATQAIDSALKVKPQHDSYSALKKLIQSMP